MPKKAHLANHYSSSELKQKYLKSQDAVESRRWHLLWKISLGWTIKNSAIAVGINYDYAKQIVKRYNGLGAAGLTNLKNKQPQQRGGKKALLTDAQLEKLRQHPDAKIELWFFDEHRVGLKPILRKVWAEVGSRPIAVVSHRYEWLYVYGFVKPQTGETIFYLIPRVNTKWLNLVYESFAKDAQISEKRKVLLVEDNAGWHRSKKATLPAGITVEFLPAYSPELQPAERLWTLVDEPLVNEYFETIEELEEVLVLRCNVLREIKAEIKSLTHYHWLNFA